MNLNEILGKKSDSKESDNNDTSTEESVDMQTAADEGSDSEEVTEEGNESKEAASKDGDPYADWTKEQLAKVLQETRQEAAKNRVAKKEVEKSLQQQFDEQLKAIEDKFEPYVKKAKELEKLKEREKDEQRSLEEKLADREMKIQALLDEKSSVEDSLQEEKVRLQSELERKAAELEAYEGYWKEQLAKELADIPEKHQKLADMVVKGAGGDAREALDAIRDAKKENVFGNKKVSVYHATPGAKDGARMDAAKAQQAKSDSLDKKGKVKEGLKDWKNLQKQRLLLKK